MGAWSEDDFGNDDAMDLVSNIGGELEQKFDKILSARKHEYEKIAAARIITTLRQMENNFFSDDIIKKATDVIEEIKNSEWMDGWKNASKKLRTLSDLLEDLKHLD